MTNRKPATPTQVRRVLEAIAAGCSERQAAEKFRLSRTTIQRIKDGTYHVAPKKNQYADRRRGQELKHRRKRTALPADYKQAEIRARTEEAQLRKASQAAINSELRASSYPDACRLIRETFNEFLDTYLDPDYTSEMFLRVQLYPEPPEPPMSFNQWFEGGGWRLEDDKEGYQDYLLTYQEDLEQAPRWVERARVQLARWHREESRHHGGVVALLSKDGRERPLAAPARPPRVAPGDLSADDLLRHLRGDSERSCAPALLPDTLDWEDLELANLELLGLI
jgi:hypothetical protein